MNADILSIAGPSSAAEGEQVILDVTVKNLSAVQQYIAVTAQMPDWIPFQFDYLLVDPGQSVVFRGWFTMPANSVTVTAWSWTWDGSQWVQEDQATKSISLAGASPQVSELQIADFAKV